VLWGKKQKSSENIVDWRPCCKTRITRILRWFAGGKIGSLKSMSLEREVSLITISWAITRGGPAPSWRVEEWQLLTGWCSKRRVKKFVYFVTASSSGLAIRACGSLAPTSPRGLLRSLRKPAVYDSTSVQCAHRGARRVCAVYLRPIVVFTT
jgi:hypothetical protein